MNIRLKFGERIKKLRIEKRLSQEKLAYQSNIDRTYISSIEKGKRNVSLEIIQKLSVGLEVSVETLMKGL